LIEYAPRLVEEGAKSVEDLKMLSEEELREDVGMKKLDARRMLRKLQEVEPPLQKRGGAQEPKKKLDPLSTKALAAAPEEQRKQMIGERLYRIIEQRQPTWPARSRECFWRWITRICCTS